jgi:hypothetical protein
MLGNPWEPQISSDHNHLRHCFSYEAAELRRILRRQNKLLDDNQVAFSNLNNRVSNQDEAQNSRHAEMLEIVTQQKRQIEKLEADYDMLYHYQVSTNHGAS